MKTLLITLILITSFSYYSLTAQGTMHNVIDHYGQYFYDIDATESDVTAAGDNIILNSTDEGETWQEIYLPNNASIKHVAKIKDQYYVAAGRMMYITRNDGIEWETLEEMDDITTMQNFGNTILITKKDENNRLMKSDDGGMSWSTLSTSPAQDPQTVYFIDSENAFLSDTLGTIYSSNNGGQNWMVVNNDQFTESLGSLRFINLDTGYAQQGDIVWETTDGGKTWTQIIDNFIARSGVYPLISGIYIRSDSRFGLYEDNSINYIQNDPTVDDLRTYDIAEANGKLYLCGTGMIVRNDLSESFNTWKDLTPGPDVGFIKMASKDGKLVVSGPSRMILSNDEGVSYSYEDNDLYRINDLAIDPEGTIYITQSSLTKSTNNGKDWEFVKGGASLVHVFDDGRLLIVASNTISESMDNGSTFNPLFDIPSGQPKDLYFFDNNLGWCLNTSGTAYRTDDGGKTWTGITFPFGASPDKMHFIDNENGYGVKNRSRLWKTSDGGITWEDIEFTEYDATLYDIYFENNQIGYVVGKDNTTDEGIVYRTDDGGNTWYIFQKGIELFYEVMRGNDSGKILVCGERGQLLSYIACETLIPTLTISEERITCSENSTSYKWFLDEEFLLETDDPFIDIVNEGIYSVRIKGNDNCISNPSEGIDVVLTNDNLIDTKHITIYPNPSYGIVNLNITDEYHLQEIHIYNLSGQLIHNAEIDTPSLNLSFLPKGSYFIRVQTAEGYRTEKIIIR